MATPDVTPPSGWVSGAPPGAPSARVNESWHRRRPTNQGLALSVSYSVRDDGYFVYQTLRRWDYNSGAEVRHINNTPALHRVDGCPGFPDPVSAMIWAEVEYG